MIISWTFLILLLSIKSRNYESIYTIRTKLFPKFHDMHILFEIFDKNDHLYKFESQDILYNFKSYFVSDIQKDIMLRNQKMEIIFNISVYEHENKIIDKKNCDIIYTELIRFGITFHQLRFFQFKSDFSFDIKYRIENFDKDIIIFFENMNELNIFKYFLFNEKDELYNNKTLYDFMKKKILDNIIEGFRKVLLTYPECNSFYHFKALLQYFTNHEFEIYYISSLYTYYKASVDFFNYEDIIKIDDVLFLQNITTKIILIYYDDYGIGYEEYDDKYDIQIISFKNISICNNLTIGYGELTKGEMFVYKIFQQIIKSIKL